MGRAQAAAPGPPGERGLQPPKGGRLPGEAARGETFVCTVPISRPALGCLPYGACTSRQPGERGLQPAKGGRLPGEAARGETFARNAHLWGVHKQAGFWRPDERGLDPLEGGQLFGEAADSPRGSLRLQCLSVGSLAPA